MIDTNIFLISVSSRDLRCFTLAQFLVVVERGGLVVEPRTNNQEALALSRHD